MGRRMMTMVVRWRSVRRRTVRRRTVRRRTTRRRTARRRTFRRSTVRRSTVRRRSMRRRTVRRRAHPSVTSRRWRAIFLVVLIFTARSIVFTRRFFRRLLSRARERLDALRQTGHLSRQRLQLFQKIREALPRDALQRSNSNKYILDVDRAHRRALGTLARCRVAVRLDGALDVALRGRFCFGCVVRVARAVVSPGDGREEIEWILLVGVIRLARHRGPNGADGCAGAFGERIYSCKKWSKWRVTRQF